MRRDMCQFADDRLSDASEARLRARAPAAAHGGSQDVSRPHRAVHATALDDAARRTPAVARRSTDIARDADARARFLDFARDADQPAVRVRMLNVAHDLGWLSIDERWDELALMLGELQARSAVGVAEVDLACTLNQEHDLDGAFNRRVRAGQPGRRRAARRRSRLPGQRRGRARTLQGLVSPNEADVRIAQAYLRHRPITDADELRRVAAGIARMTSVRCTGARAGGPGPALCVRSRDPGHADTALRGRRRHGPSRPRSQAS